MIKNDEAQMTRLREATARQANDKGSPNAQMTKEQATASFRHSGFVIRHSSFSSS
jgi:hypothetical protein